MAVDVFKGESVFLQILICRKRGRAKSEPGGLAPCDRKTREKHSPLTRLGSKVMATGRLRGDLGEGGTGGRPCSRVTGTHCLTATGTTASRNQQCPESSLGVGFQPPFSQSCTSPTPRPPSPRLQALQALPRPFLLSASFKVIPGTLPFSLLFSAPVFFLPPPSHPLAKTSPQASDKPELVMPLYPYSPAPVISAPPPAASAPTRQCPSPHPGLLPSPACEQQAWPSSLASKLLLLSTPPIPLSPPSLIILHLHYSRAIPLVSPL